jgi:Chemotaxis response regulator containing a CheY-like receiver domain and a methylesterase domain
LDWFYYELILKIKIASVAKVKNNVPVLFPQRTSELRAGTCNIIAIGASTGGTEAIFDIICKLPRNSPGIVIVQHMPPVFTGMYAERLNKSCELEVIEAKKGDVVYPGRVLIAPGGFMMRLIYKNGIYSVDCFEADKVNGHIPSVDVLFESTAKAAKEKAIGVLLTGMGSDGAKGLLAMKQAGAFTIGQDEASCVVYGMPKVAYELGAVELQVPLKNIAQVIIETLAM